MAYMKILNSCWQCGTEISDNASSVLRWIPILLGSSLNSGRNHLNFSYTLMGYKLAAITLEKDLCLTGEKLSENICSVVPWWSKEQRTQWVMSGKMCRTKLKFPYCCYIYGCVIFISVLNASGIPECQGKCCKCSSLVSDYPLFGFKVRNDSLFYFYL